MNFIAGALRVDGRRDEAVLLGSAIKGIHLHPQFGSVAGVLVGDEDCLHVVLDPNVPAEGGLHCDGLVQGVGTAVVLVQVDFGCF